MLWMNYDRRWSTMYISTCCPLLGQLVGDQNWQLEFSQKLRSSSLFCWLILFFFFLSLLSDKFTQDFGDCLMSRDCEREALKWFRLPAVRIVGTKLTVQIWGHSWISHEEILSEGTISLHSFADAKRLENELKIFRAFRKKTKSRGDIRKKKVEIFYHFHLSFMNTKCRGKCLNNYFIHLSCFF